MQRISMQTLIEFGTLLLVKRGVPESNARYLSSFVVETEAFRQSTHGLVQFTTMNKQIGETIDPAAEPEIIRDRGSMALISGERCFGNLAMKLAVETGIKKAHTHGIGFIAVRNTHWIGALGMHLIPVARQGLLVKAWAQTSSCKDCAPYGAIDARFSTNPIAIAFPTATNPVVADFSTATMSMSAVLALKRKGNTTLVQRFVDNSGKPSNDPAVFDDGGTMMFSGLDLEGYKFYGLSLFNEALTVLAGGSANNPASPSYQSFALIVLDPDAFAGAEYYQREMKRYLDFVKKARPRPGFEVRLPGERGFAALEDCRKNGIPLSDEKLGLLNKLAKAVEIAVIA
ncbi:Ldh family oxidoreductase [candidate division KSB1 bacterium]|nr:Ldh family oxidoreductase [candidate division KSB1 bacterium]